ncbi:MAG TPA: acetyl-CoA carboxylase biotin carboxylase subunit [Candidatus Thermoplasmatota archaeon]|nr:acetyl-CoA carboxylase biotin carboxylase subunit [Candidatus Thermoplasmatota archaeon]
MFKKILIANRGEIALRIIWACKELGIKTVAVYSEADRDSLHVRFADEAVCIGPAKSKDSYLNITRIIAAAEISGAEAIHPGYGFLSEQAGFARACAKAGVAFVGPPPEAIEALGDKVRARQLAIREGVPVAPGSAGAVEDADEALAVAHRIGFPVMLKAAGGGGGMGLRVARTATELPTLFAQASAQAQAAFGNGAMFVEKFLERPRHIEVQVLGDQRGHLIHLGERECSIQRRHQKLLEEAPSPALNAQQRATLGGLAVKLAKAGGYANAGTLEFLFQDGAFHFNEMNTRLQVEHPVTEMLTGIDLVQWQLRIAAGEPLTIAQEQVQWRGHALECRINAEDPLHDFRPAPGLVRKLRLPAGERVRVDHGLAEGWTVPAHYDSLVAKVITWGDDRAACVQRMAGALHSFQLEGFPTNVALHQRILADEAFRRGELSTRFLEERGVLAALQEEARARLAASEERAAILAAALAMGPWGGLGTLHHVHTLPPRLDREVP